MSKVAIYVIGADFGVGGVGLTRPADFISLELPRISIESFFVTLIYCIMSSFNIVVFGGDHCGPEVSCWELL